MVIFAFCFLGCFALFMGTMPVDFISQTWNPTYIEKEVAQFYSITNSTLYINTETFNLSYPESKSYAWGLPDGHEIEFWWGFYTFPYEYPRALHYQSLQVRHTWDGLFGWWREYEILHKIDPYWSRTKTPDYVYGEGYADIITLRRVDLETLFDPSTNSSFCAWEKSGYKTNAHIFSPNASWTIGEAWDNNELSFMVSWEIDWNSTNINAWTLLGQLLTFQSPNLGIGGVWGVVFDTMIAIPIWIFTAIAVIKLIQSMIPFLNGLRE